MHHYQWCTDHVSYDSDQGFWHWMIRLVKIYPNTTYKCITTVRDANPRCRSNWFNGNLTSCCQVSYFKNAILSYHHLFIRKTPDSERSSCFELKTFSFFATKSISKYWNIQAISKAHELWYSSSVCDYTST